MNKKSWTRVLIVVVAGLWAYNIYRTVQNYQVAEEKRELETTTPLAFNTVMMNKDTFSLELPYQDPFLRTESYQRERNNSRTVTPENRVSNSRPSTSNQRNIRGNSADQEKWPDIKYYGFLKNQDGNKGALCMVSIANRMHRFHQSETRNGVKIIQASRDSVKLEFEGTMRFFPVQHL